MRTNPKRTAWTATQLGLVALVVLAASVPVDAQTGNGVASFFSATPSFETVLLEDCISDAIGVDMSATPGSSSVVSNDQVAPPHDLANTYVDAAMDFSGGLVIYVLSGRLEGGSGSSFVDIELNQNFVGVRSGDPWPIQGERSPGDVLVRLQLDSGVLSSVEFRTWSVAGYQTLSAVEPLLSEACDGVQDLYAFCQRSLLAEDPELALLTSSDTVFDDAGNPVEVPKPDQLVELGFNLPAVFGYDTEFTSIQVRTPQDTALGTFRLMGHWAQTAQGGS